MQFRRGKRSPWFVQIRDASGDLQVKSFVRKDDALEYESKMRRERQLVRAGLELPIEESLFLDFCKKYIRDRSRDRELAPQTWKQEAKKLKLVWIPKFAGRLIASIRTEEIKKVLDDLLDQGLAPATRNRHRALLHTLFKQAVRERKLTRNPVTEIELLSEKKKVKPHGQWQDLSRVEAYLKAAFEDNPAYGVFGTLAIFTGLRVGEVIGLTWDAVDWKNRKITARQILDRDEYRIVERIKGEGEGGITEVPLFPRVRDTLLSWRSKATFTRPTDFILASDDGSYMSYWTIQKAHHRIREKAGLPRVTIHGLRRTFASIAHEMGFSHGELKTVMGHSTILTTEKYTTTRLDPLLDKAERLGFGASPKIRSLKSKRGGK